MISFSVIVPTFNRGNKIIKTIESVLNQSFTNFELIIIDDGSKDNTKSIINESFNDIRIKYHYQKNTGVCSARNNGASFAKSNYLIFLDSDDLVSKNWLEAFYCKLNITKCDLVFCGIKIFSSEFEYVIKPAEYPKGSNKSNGNFIPGSFCISKECFFKSGAYDENITYGENSELSFRLMNLNLSLGFIDEANLNYFASTDGGSKNWPNKLNSILYTLEKHKKMFQRQKLLKSQYYGVAGLAAFKCGKTVLSQNLFYKSFISFPLNMKSFFRLILSLAPCLAKLKWR